MRLTVGFESKTGKKKIRNFINFSQESMKTNVLLIKV